MTENKSAWHTRRFLGIMVWEVLLFLGFYVFFAWVYHITLYLNQSGFQKPDFGMFNLREFATHAGMQYGIMLLLSVMVWLVVFRLLSKRALWIRLVVNLAVLVPWVLAQQSLYYFACEKLDVWHLQGSGQIWDMYIPGLFFLLQFGLIHAYTYFLSNQKKLRVEVELKNAALNSELSAIKAQLNPHFLYNVFNSINASIPPEQERTREMIAQLSDLFRYQLRASREDLVPLRDELDFVNGYLGLEKHRFEERLQIRVEVDENLLDELVPPMILQPLVENSVKHGLSGLIEGGEVSIRVEYLGGKLHFEVADTGVGVEDKVAAISSGVGLSNTQLRLQKRYNTALHLMDNSPRGLKVQFDL